MIRKTQRHIEKKDGNTLIVNNTLNVNVNINISFPGSRKDMEKALDCERFYIEIYNPVQKRNLEFEKEIRVIKEKKDLHEIEDLHDRIESYFEEVIKIGINKGFLSNVLMSKEELDKFKIGKQYIDFAEFDQRRKIQDLHDKILRKLLNNK